MDVVKAKKKNNGIFKSKTSISALLAALLIFMLIWANHTRGSISVERNTLLIEKVKRGDLEVIIEGYGTLTSNKQQLITSFSAATVKEIVLKPGAKVHANSVIVRLENPELRQQVENAEQELTQSNANLRQLKLNNQREKLNETANLAEIVARFETASLRRQAEEKLVEKGIVSRLNFQETLLNEKQLKQRIDILKQRNEQLALVHEEAIKIQIEQIKQQQGQLRIAQSRLDKLTIHAGFDGVLQRLSVELGQSITAGGEVALIGSVTDLIALIRVPQSQAQQVIIGQSAVIDTHRDKIQGLVARIDPIVDNNTVEVEISLPKSLPASARPQLSVDGIIIAETLSNVAYIKRPAGIKSNTKASFYQVNDDDAELKQVQFGSQAGQNIEVLSGAQPGEQFIISDLNNLKTSNNRISIN